MAQAFESVKSFINRIKELIPDAKQIRCLFNQFTVSKFGKITVKPVFIIVNQAKIEFAKLNYVCPDIWINTSKSQEALHLNHDSAYELVISTDEKHYTRTADGSEITFYPHSIRQLENKNIIKKVKSASEEDLNQIL